MAVGALERILRFVKSCMFALQGHLILCGAGLACEESFPATSCDAIPPGGGSAPAGKSHVARF